MEKKYPELLNKIKSQFSMIVGMNYSLTPTIVKKVADKKCEVFFAYIVTREKKILRPYLKLVTDFNTGQFLEFKNAYYSEFADSEKYPLNTEFDAKIPTAETAKEQMNLIKNLQLLYEKVREFAFEKNLSDEQKNILEDYLKCLSKTIPTDLLNFCKNTEPEFFNWIEVSCL